MHALEGTASRTMYKRTTNVMSACKPAFAGAAMLAASSGFATETILVNELGGAGLDQVAPIIASTSHGSLVIFEDCRSGRDSNYRARAMDANGGAYGSSVSLHAILTGFEDISQLSLDGNETGEAVLLWTDSRGIYVKFVIILSSNLHTQKDTVRR